MERDMFLLKNAQKHIGIKRVKISKKVIAKGF